MSEDKENRLILESNLQSYFLDQLIEINKKSTNPLPNEAIYYSSLVLDYFGESNHFFEEINGKVQDKRLGIKLLESSQLPTQAQIRELRNIGDTALFLCGHFSESLNKKTIDINYYQDLGKMAYKKLNIYIPNLYKVNSFFLNLSDLFESMTEIMTILSKKAKDIEEEKFCIYIPQKNSSKNPS